MPGRPTFGGMDVSYAEQLKALEEENARLKRLLAESMLDQAALKDLLPRNWWSDSRPYAEERYRS